MTRDPLDKVAQAQRHLIRLRAGVSAHHPSEVRTFVHEGQRERYGSRDTFCDFLTHAAGIIDGVGSRGPS